MKRTKKEDSDVIIAKLASERLKRIPRRNINIP